MWHFPQVRSYAKPALRVSGQNRLLDAMNEASSGLGTGLVRAAGELQEGISLFALMFPSFFILFFVLFLVPRSARQKPYLQRVAKKYSIRPLDLR
jgi:hypothetical protein